MNHPVSSRSAPLLDDQPSAVDLLNFEQYSAALSEVILNPQTKTPFIIGILGRWGTGKTTLMRMLERQLEGRNVTTVWFSAWLYDREQEIWAAFLQSLVSRLARRLPLRDQLHFSLGVFRSGFTWDRLLYELPQLLARALLVAIPAVAGAVLASATVSGTATLLLQSSGVVGSVLLAGWYLLRPALQAARAAATPDFTLYRSLDFENHVGFLDRFREQFGRIVAALPGARARVVVFVDDLDRCNPDKALTLLDAIKVFLDVPECVFVLGLDLSVIQKALANKYPDDPLSQKEYLGKIVQLPFQLPPLTEADLDSYLRRLDVAFPDERCRAVFLAALPRNPRELKRVINTYSLHWYLAQARVAGNGVTPVRLAKLIVIQQAFGPLFSLLRDQPMLLPLLERTLRGTPQEAAAAAPQLRDVTQAVAPTGVSLPPALLPFASEPALAKLLTMHPSAPAPSDDANFEHLSADEIAVYFTFARRPARADAASPYAEAGRVPLEDVPNFGPHFLVLEKLGSGGVGEVYLAEDRRLGRKVTIKRLVGTLTGDPDWLARFRRELTVMAGIPPHPNIAAVLDSGQGTDVDGREFPFYVMEYVPGEGLDTVLQRRGRLELDETRRYLGPVFEALAHLHKHGLVHRDLKPSAIRISAYGVPRLTDFSLTLRPVEGRDNLTSTGVVLGTPAYMSPEQARGEPVDGRADLFSLGVILFECLTGTNPIKSDSTAQTLMLLLTRPMPRPSEILPALPPAIDAFMARLLAPSADDRFSFAEDALLAFETATASPPSASVSTAPAGA